MAGSVYEWCRDAFGQYKPKSDDSIDPLGPRAEEFNGTPPRVVRGGSLVTLQDFRAADRDWDDPNSRDSTKGFRLVSSRLRP
jgi:formylglycine-generating enzyme required for sulfatase activity